RATDLCAMLNSFESLPEFLCLTETWLSNSDILNVPNYKLITHNRNSMGGESAIACRNDIKFISFKTDALERLCLKYNINCCSIRFLINNTYIILVSIYNPLNNTSCDKHGWEEILTSFDNYNNVIITGDFN
ncbi:hypothetical protein EAI_00835, partial [Harpegnathos saltator]